MSCDRALGEGVARVVPFDQGLSRSDWGLDHKIKRLFNL